MNTDAREMVVFVSYENAGSPQQIAREMIEALQIERPAIGVDLFTGGCEVRIGYDETRLRAIRAWLTQRAIVHDINFV